MFLVFRSTPYSPICILSSDGVILSTVVSKIHSLRLVTLVVPVWPLFVEKMAVLLWARLWHELGTRGNWVLIIASYKRHFSEKEKKKEIRQFCQKNKNKKNKLGHSDKKKSE